MRGRLPEITEGIGGGVEGLPAGKQPVVERTELQVLSEHGNKPETIILRLIPGYMPIFISQSKLQLLQNL